MIPQWLVIVFAVMAAIVALTVLLVWCILHTGKEGDIIPGDLVNEIEMSKCMPTNNGKELNVWAIVEEVPGVNPHWLVYDPDRKLHSKFNTLNGAKKWCLSRCYNFRIEGFVP